MEFDIKQDKFLSATHKSIWHSALFLASFYEAVPANLSAGETANLLEGERNLYRFIKDLYSDMYNNPGLYYLPVGEYDRYMNGRERKDLHHKNDQKESSLRNKFQQPIQFYQKFLFEIGTRSEADYSTFNLNIHKSDFHDIYRDMKLSKVRGEEEKLAKALNNLGLEIIEKAADKIHVANMKYPKMLLALSALCRSSNKKYTLTNFLRCDFRGLINGFKPRFEDTLAVLSQDLKENAVELNKFMQGLNCKASIEPLKNITLYSKWKVNYSLDGKSVFSFCSDINSLELFAYFNHHENISRMGYILKDKSIELYNWFYEKMPARTCSCRNNNLVDIGGQKKRICGLMNRLDVGNPTINDLKNIENVIGTYIDRAKDKFI